MKPEVILDLIRKASLFDIFIISFLLLPFIASEWLSILTQLSWNKPWGLAVMLVAYVIGINLMFIGSSRANRREVARDQIVGHLNSKGFTMMSCERIRDRINPGYNDMFLGTLPFYFPDVFRKAKLRGGKEGLALVSDEPVVDEG